tara:strand:- start:217 stop:480 length:264 start_codon:yes stop_codon:yes gene_type:complete
MTKEDHINIVLLLATFRSFNEQLYNLKGIHKQDLKKQFNSMILNAKHYESLIIDSNNEINNLAIEEMYNAITEVIYSIRKQVYEKAE